MNFSIIIPVYNEEKTISQILADLKNLVSAHQYDCEIIVVNDGSTDKTKDILVKIPNIKIIEHLNNQGYGAALKTGFKASTKNYILIIDGDGTYPIQVIPELVKYAPDYDLISGIRSGKNFDQRWFYLQRLAKFFLKILINYITKSKVPDINCGLRIFKKNIIEKYWNLYPQGFSFTTTSLVAFLANGYQTKFVPIDYHERQNKSTLKPLISFINFINLILKLSLFFKPLKVFLPLSLFILFTSISIAIYGLVINNVFYDTTTILLAITALQTFFFGLLAEIIVHNRKN